MGSVAIIGLGAIGSALVPLVARMPGVVQIVLIDPDSYDESNLITQAIDGSALGKPKAIVQAARIDVIDPSIQVDAVVDRVENVPLTRLLDCVMASCVDNRLARQTINTRSFRCGQPWIDAAIDAPSLLRVAVYRPGESSPCLECGWDDRTYELLEQRYPCHGGELSVPATGAPAELGTLAAAFQACELRKLLSAHTNEVRGEETPTAAQMLFDTSTYERHLVGFSRNDQCRFDHQTWEIESVEITPEASTLEDLFDAVSADPDSTIGLEGHAFATYVDCLDCGRRVGVGLSIYARVSNDARSCSCGGRLMPTGFFSFEAIRRSDLSLEILGRGLVRMGLRSGDVITVTDSAGNKRYAAIGEVAHD